MRLRRGTSSAYSGAFLIGLSPSVVVRFFLAVAERAKTGGRAAPTMKCKFHANSTTGMEKTALKYVYLVILSKRGIVANLMRPPPPAIDARFNEGAKQCNRDARLPTDPNK